MKYFVVYQTYLSWAALACLLSSRSVLQLAGKADYQIHSWLSSFPRLSPLNGN